MNRPITGRTPDKDRQAKTLADLRKSGGDKVAVNLPAEAMAHLRAIMGARGYRTKKEAIIEALALLAKKVR